jgi:phytol kinase
LIIAQVVGAFCADYVINPHHPYVPSRISSSKNLNLQEHQQRYILQSQETVQQMVMFQEHDTLFDENVKKEKPLHVVDDQEHQLESVTTVSSKRSLVLQFAVSTLATVAFGAKFGIIEGYDNDLMIAQDAGAAVLTGVLAYAFVKLNSWLVETGRLESRDSRKIIHCFSAPLFILFWPIFSNNLGARFFAGVVTMVNALRLILAAQGGDDEQGLAKAVSRTGNAKEALGGPFVYILIVQAAIWLFWRSSPVGVIALSTMAAGDGFADLVGRRWGKNNKWWFSPQKSIAGSLAFLVASTLCGAGLVSWLQFSGCLELPASMMFSDVALRIAGISAVSALLELLPVGDDNLTVPLSAAAMALLFFR